MYVMKRTSKKEMWREYGKEITVTPEKTRLIVGNGEITYVKERASNKDKKILNLLSLEKIEDILLQLKEK